MKHLVMALVLVVSSAAFSANQQSQEIRHFAEEIPVTGEFSFPLQTNRRSPFEEGSIVEIVKILNMGFKTWKLIEDNKPILGVKHIYANALPKGLTSSEDLYGFSDLNARAFHVWGESLYGTRVYDLEYVALHRHGGAYDGKGQYIENATVFPQHVEVSWGYTLNYKVTNVSTVNVGTRENPIASLLLETELTVSTMLYKTQTRETFEFRGDSPDVKVIR